MTCQMLLTNKIPCYGNVVIKRALLVTDRIPDKMGLPSQVYRAPGAILQLAHRVPSSLWLLILHLASRGVTFLMAPDSAVCIDDLGAYINVSSTQKKGYSKEGKLRAFPSHCYTC